MTYIHNILTEYIYIYTYLHYNIHHALYMFTCIITHIMYHIGIGIILYYICCMCRNEKIFTRVESKKFLQMALADSGR